MTANPTDEFVSIDGPFRKTASGRFDRNGDPIKVACPAFWVVRYLGGQNTSIVRDVRFASLAAAQAFRDTFANAKK